MGAAHWAVARQFHHARVLIVARRDASESGPGGCRNRSARTGKRVASTWPFPTGRLANGQTRSGVPHHPSTWRRLWWCNRGALCPCSGGPSAALWPPPSCWPGQRARNAALPSPPAGRRRPNAQARTAILPPVEVRPVSRAIPTLSNLTSHIQRSVPGGRPTFTPARLQPHSFAPTSATPIIDPLCALPPQASGELVRSSQSRWASGHHHWQRPP
jgi:hypothetical protein